MSTNRNVKPKSKGKSKTKRSISRNDQKKDYTNNDDKSVKSTDYNDPSWRIANATTILDRATKFVFNDYQHVYDNHLDEFAPLSCYNPDKTVQDTVNMPPRAQVPSIMAIRLNPSPGSNSSGAVSAVKQQAQALYTSLSSMNSKTTNYAPQDLIMPILALGEVISTVEWMRRAFRSVYMYNAKNRAIPRALVEAMGFDYDDLCKNYANYVARANTIIDRAMSITLPSNIDYFKACNALYQDVFLDDDSDMAQMYLFVPYSTWLLNEQSQDTGTSLTTYIWREYTSAGLLTMDRVLNTLKLMVDHLLTSSTMNYVYADIQNFAAKKGAQLAAIAPIVVGEGITPIYSEEALLQIMNIDFMDQPVVNAEGNGNHTNANDVLSDPNTNSIMYYPVWAYNSFNSIPSSVGNLVNFNKMNPTDEEIMTAMRFKCAVKEYLIDDTSDTLNINTGTDVSLPDHYAVDAWFYGPKLEDPFGSNAYHWGTMKSNMSLQLSWLPKFNHHPRLTWVDVTNYVKSNTGVSFTKTYNGVIGDLNYWTYLPYQSVRAINDGAMLSLFKVNEVFNSYNELSTK